MGALDLTTLANAKRAAAVAITNSGDDDFFSLLISSVSQVLLSVMGRATLLSKTYNETYDGVGNRGLMLRQYPVTAITSLKVAAPYAIPPYTSVSGSPTVIPAQIQPGQSPGYYLDPWDGYPPGKPQRLTLVGYAFPRVKASIFVTYQAGYAVQNESQVITSNGQVTPSSPYGMCAADVGVTDETGTAYTPVASNPASGQYVPPSPFASNGAPYYQFSVADANKTVLLNYSFIPSGVEEVCRRIVAEQYKYRNRIGERSRALSGGGETASYDLSAMPQWAVLALQPYKRVVPI